ncbi:MAG: hypothetical protein ACREVV_03020 [Steroidobacteraceae bacterium]
MTDSRPPPWAESLLRCSLSRADYEVVSGDLLEDFQEAGGDPGAASQYSRQAIIAALRLGLARRGLIATGCFLVLAMLWLAVMKLTFGHPPYLMHVTLAAAVAVNCLLSINAMCGLAPKSWPLVRAGLLAGGGLGLWGFAANLLASDFEGYIALIGAALVAQAILSLVATPVVRVQH